MRLIKEIAKEVLKIFLCIIWLLFYWAGYIFMSLPKVMITCIVIDTVCAVIMYLIKDPDNKETEEKLR